MRLRQQKRLCLEEKGMLAGVTDYRRSWKWGCRGRLALGFKPRHGSHTRERTTLLWQSGDPVAATQLMVLGT